jgi:hypothetical protein
MKRLEIDFNARDERGWIPAVAEDADEFRSGEWVDLFDDEGNTCIGRVGVVEDNWLSVEPQWASFSEPGANRLIVDSARPWSVPARWTSPLTVGISAPILRLAFGSGNPEVRTDPLVLDARHRVTSGA